MTTIIGKIGNQILDFGGETILFLVEYLVDKFHIIDPIIAIGSAIFIASYVIFYIVSLFANQLSYTKASFIITAIIIGITLIDISTIENRASIAHTEAIYDLSSLATTNGRVWIMIISIMSIYSYFSNAYYSNLFNRNNS